MKIRTQYKYDICDLTRDEFTGLNIFLWDSSLVEDIN